VRTEVFAPNRPARRLYARLGFVERDLQLIRPLPAGDATAATGAGGR
jgi:hypothetical protein